MRTPKKSLVHYFLVQIYMILFYRYPNLVQHLYCTCIVCSLGWGFYNTLRSHVGRSNICTWLCGVRFVFSSCWCCERMASLFTWTGMGTTILGLLDTWSGPALPWIIPALTLFHLARLFWNQILTWTSLNFRLCAIWDRSVSDKYFLLWNSFSNSSNCSLVNAVLLRLVFRDTGADLSRIVFVSWSCSMCVFGDLGSSNTDIVSVSSLSSSLTSLELWPNPFSSLSEAVGFSCMVPEISQFLKY